MRLSCLCSKFLKSPSKAASSKATSASPLKRKKGVAEEEDDAVAAKQSPSKAISSKTTTPLKRKKADVEDEDDAVEAEAVAASPSKKAGQPAATVMSLTNSSGNASTFDPSRDSYHPIKHAIWKKGEK